MSLPSYFDDLFFLDNNNNHDRDDIVPDAVASLENEDAVIVTSNSDVLALMQAELRFLESSDNDDNVPIDDNEPNGHYHHDAMPDPVHSENPEHFNFEQLSDDEMFAIFRELVRNAPAREPVVSPASANLVVPDPILSQYQEEDQQQQHNDDNGDEDNMSEPTAVTSTTTTTTTTINRSNPSPRSKKRRAPSPPTRVQPPRKCKKKAATTRNNDNNDNNNNNNTNNNNDALIATANAVATTAPNTATTGSAPTRIQPARRCKKRNYESVLQTTMTTLQQQQHQTNENMVAAPSVAPTMTTTAATTRKRQRLLGYQDRNPLYMCGNPLGILDDMNDMVRDEPNPRITDNATRKVLQTRVQDLAHALDTAAVETFQGTCYNLMEDVETDMIQFYHDWAGEILTEPGFLQASSEADWMKDRMEETQGRPLLLEIESTTGKIVLAYSDPVDLNAGISFRPQTSFLVSNVVDLGFGLVIVQMKEVLAS